MGDLIVPIVFFVMIAGFVTLGVGLNVFQKWAKHRFMSGSATEERFMAMEERLAELEESVDAAEHLVAERQSRPRLESRDSRS